MERLTLLGEIHAREVSEILIEGYWKMFSEYSEEVFSSAFERVVKECAWFPKPADFFKFLDAKQADEVIAALELVIYAVEHVGNYTSVKFSDPAIHSVIELMGGWPKFSTATEEEWIWLKKDFLKFYPTMAKKNIHPEYLPGTLEIDNVARGFKWTKKPKMIAMPQPRKRIEQPKIENKAIELEAPQLRPVQKLVMTTFEERRAA
jgi:hypothetical protein